MRPQGACRLTGGYRIRPYGVNRRDIRISAKEVEKLLSRLFFFTQKQQGGRTTPYILIRGGYWSGGGVAGVFYSYLADPRSDAGGSLGGRSAYFKKH